MLVWRNRAFSLILTAMTKLPIEMISDLVCPWCWLGLRRLRAAMALAPEVEVDLYFRPYELDPSTPPEGSDYKAAMAKKFASPEAKEHSKRMRDALIAYGEEDGVPFTFDKITRRPNTINAHRVVRWAQGQGAGLDAKEALFSAYFEHGRDIGELDVLTEIGASVGLDRDLLADLLAGDADVDKVRAEAEEFRQMGVTGVPTFLAGRAIAVQGAESAEKLAKFLRHSWDQFQQAKAAAAEGASA